jgi:hypothetical protein
VFDLNWSSLPPLHYSMSWLEADMQKLGSLCDVTPGGGSEAATMENSAGHLMDVVPLVGSTPRQAQAEGMGKVELRAYL